MKSKSKGGLCLVALLLLTFAIIVILLFVPKEVLSVQEVVATPPVVATTSAPVAIAKTPSVEKTSKVMPQVLIDIGWCESQNDQSKIGYNYRVKTITDANGATSTIKYLWSRDIGTYQINEYYHAQTAKKLGMDIYTAEGNAQYALVLYNSNGTKDWSASKSCWSDIATYKAKHKSFY